MLHQRSRAVPARKVSRAAQTRIKLRPRTPGATKRSRERDGWAFPQSLGEIIRARESFVRRQSLPRLKQTEWEKFSVYARIFRRCDKFREFMLQKVVCCRRSRSSTQGFRFRRSFRQIKSHLKVKTKTWSGAVGEINSELLEFGFFGFAEGTNGDKRLRVHFHRRPNESCLHSACLDLTDRQRNQFAANFI